MYIYSSRITRIFISPYNIQKVLSAVYLTWIHSKQFQKIELFGGQINLFPPDDHTSAFTVDLHLTFDDYFIILLIFITLTDPAYDCFNSCFDFQNIKWLCYVVICTVFQSQNFIHIITLSRKHDDRNIRIFPDLLTHFKTIMFWKHNIQQNHIFNPFYFHQIFNLLKCSMFFPVTHDRICLRFADS